jgi:hypothetical protein
MNSVVSIYRIFLKRGEKFLTNIKKIRKYLVAIAILVITLTIIAYAARTVTQQVSSTGTITTSPDIAVYSDEACTNVISAIDWGSVEAGSTGTQTIYVKNTGTGIMTLSMTVSNWTPSGAGTYITISWDQEGTQLLAGQSVAAMITLSASTSTVGISSFSNTITISGTG